MKLIMTTKITLLFAALLCPMMPSFAMRGDLGQNNVQGDQAEKRTCPICLTDINQDEVCVRLNCHDMHIQHLGCLEQLVRVNGARDDNFGLRPVTCPECREQAAVRNSSLLAVPGHQLSVEETAQWNFICNHQGVRFIRDAQPQAAVPQAGPALVDPVVRQENNRQRNEIEERLQQQLQVIQNHLNGIERSYADFAQDDDIGEFEENTLLDDAMRYIDSAVQEIRVVQATLNNIQHPVRDEAAVDLTSRQVMQVHDYIRRYNEEAARARGILGRVEEFVSRLIRVDLERVRQNLELGDLAEVAQDIADQARNLVMGEQLIRRNLEELRVRRQQAFDRCAELAQRAQVLAGDVIDCEARIREVRVRMQAENARRVAQQVAPQGQLQMVAPAVMVQRNQGMIPQPVPVKPAPVAQPKRQVRKRVVVRPQRRPAARCCARQGAQDVRRAIKPAAKRRQFLAIRKVVVRKKLTARRLAARRVALAFKATKVAAAKKVAVKRKK